MTTGGIYRLGAEDRYPGRPTMTVVGCGGAGCNMLARATERGWDLGHHVAVNTDGISDCAAGARVILIKDSQKIDETVTDGFGDFKFDNLEDNSGHYQLEIEYKDYERKTVAVELKNSINVGDIYL